MIFFKSKYLKQAQEIRSTPIKENDRRNTDKNRLAKKKEEKINLKIPNIPNFNNRLARNKEMEELASQCTSGNQ